MKYNIGDFGQASFKMKKRGCETGFCGYGTIIDQDDRFVLFQDNDEFEYVIAKAKFNFVPENKKPGITTNPG